MRERERPRKRKSEKFHFISLIENLQIYVCVPKLVTDLGKTSYDSITLVE